MSSVRIRLARTAGRKFHPIYRIRVQAGRAGRDGKYIEEIGTYYPITESRADVRRLPFLGLPLLPACRRCCCLPLPACRRCR